MEDMKCPMCGCPTFYVKDPEDEFETHEFDCVNGEVVFSSDENGSEHLEINEKTETYCNRCAWHGAYGDLKTSRG